jgi:hypothetical protein
MAIEETWDDTFETLPTDIEKFKLGPDKIRDIKKATRSRMQIDHEFATAASGTDTGYHKRVTFKKVSGGPSEAASGYVECAYDSDDNLIKYFPEGGAEEVLVEKDAAQTLTNKTLTTPTLTTPQVNEAVNLTSTSTELNQLDGVSVGGNTSGDIITTDATQTITNKTLSGDSNAIDEVDSIKDQGAVSADGLKVAIIEIGDWNMDSTGNITVAHGLTYANIISYTVIVRNDIDNVRINLDTPMNGSVAGWVWLNSTLFQLYRTNAGWYDNTGYDSTSFNRGWITIWYMV